jgi:hypothetical protein
MGNEKETSKVLEKVLFPKIFQSFRISVHYKNLIIAFLALVDICLAGWLMDYSKSVCATTDPQGNVIETELQVYMTTPDQMQSYITSASDRTGVFSTIWRFTAEKFHASLNSLFAFNIPAVAANIRDYFRAAGWAVRYHPVYCIIFGVIKLIVFTIAGGAICRIAALQFARNEKPGLTEALRYSVKKFTSFVTAPLAPVVFIVILGFIIVLVGLVGNFRWAGELIMAICIVPALFFGALIALISIGTVLGFNLMFPAVAYDGSDCFDAISRSLCYVNAKPWRMIIYSIIAAVYGAICYVFVQFVAFLTLWFTHRFLQLGIRNSKLENIWSGPSLVNLVDLPNVSAASTTETIAAIIIYIFILAVVLLVVSFLLSYYFSANTIIYSLMRNKVDNTALDDVYTLSEDIDNDLMPTESEPDEENSSS